MYYAKVIDGEIKGYGIANDVFPNVSFPITGPDDDFLNENFGVRVLSTIEHDPTKYKLEFSEPYILDEKVYHVKLTKFTKSEASELSKALADFEALQEGS
jgi:hypothetical protein